MFTLKNIHGVKRRDCIFPKVHSSLNDDLDAILKYRSGFISSFMAFLFYRFITSDLLWNYFAEVARMKFFSQDTSDVYSRVESIKVGWLKWQENGTKIRRSASRGACFNFGSGLYLLCLAVHLGYLFLIRI